MNMFSKTLFIFTAGWIALLWPPGAFCADVIKFRHVATIYAGSQQLGLKQPEGVGCDDKSLLIVADSGNARLLRYTFRDNTAIPTAFETKVPQLAYPVRVQMNSQKDIFVLDGKLRRIARLTASGKFVSYIDPKAGTSPTTYAPRRFHIDGSDNIYILDISSEQVIVLTPQGKPLKNIPFPKPYGFITDLTVDASGNVLLLDGVDARVFVKTEKSTGFTALSENLKAYMRFPANMAIDRRGRIYLVDNNDGKIIILNRDGSFLGRLSARGWKEGLLNHPSQICLNDRDEIFVADTGNNRVQVFAEIESK